MNRCIFSDGPARTYRYTLEHVWDEIQPEKLVMWIGLNPSTADENQLDPTLRRIRTFSQILGFTGFVMTNLFAFRATDPRDMCRTATPIGPLNDELLMRTALRCDLIVAAWGTHGVHMSRDAAVARMMDSAGHQLYCLGENADGSPKHPLYVPTNTVLRLWKGAVIHAS